MFLYVFVSSKSITIRDRSLIPKQITNAFRTPYRLELRLPAPARAVRALTGGSMGCGGSLQGDKDQRVSLVSWGLKLHTETECNAKTPNEMETHWIQ